jgi:hypothetical protein
LDSDLRLQGGVASEILLVRYAVYVWIVEVAFAMLVVVISRRRRCKGLWILKNVRQKVGELVIEKMVVSNRRISPPSLFQFFHVAPGSLFSSI